MRRYILLFFIFLLSGFSFVKLPIPSSLVNTLYTVAGVMFSVGMSLIIAVNTQSIRHPDAKKDVQKKLNKLLYRYIAIFMILTTVYAVTLAFKEVDKESFKTLSWSIRDKVIVFNYPISLAALEIVSIIYYIINMMDTRKQYYEIENMIENEQL